MKVFALVILFIICASSNGLRCATTKDGLFLNNSFNDLTSNVLLKKIKGLKNEEFDYDMCRMSFNIDYNKGILIVQFTEHLKTRTLPDKRVRIDTYMRGTNVQQTDTTHFIEYACSKDLCEIEFVKKYRVLLNWLLEDHYSKFWYQIGSLIVGNGTSQGE